MVLQARLELPVIVEGACLEGREVEPFLRRLCAKLVPPMGVVQAQFFSEYIERPEELEDF